MVKREIFILKTGLTRCSRCGEDVEMAVYVDYMGRWLCKNCFIEFYEKKLRNTVLKYRMFSSSDLIGVAVSGGKDSMAMLTALSKVFPDLKIKAIHINLGIGDYSRDSENAVRRLCDQLEVELIIYDLKKHDGFGLPDLMKTAYRKRICGACGIIRRYLLNRIAWENGVRVVATGHTLDDTVELLFELYLNGRIEEIVRVKPVLEGGERLVKKVKPLIELTDQENKYYADFTETPYSEFECPLARGSRMLKRKELILRIEKEIPGFRHTFYKSHVKRFLPKLDGLIRRPELRACRNCGMPTIGDVCSYCKLVSKVLEVVKG
ncbi:MAG TPA: hypothetical protein ENF33_04370 [Nitrososphaeria archaeon]|nr:hypothetical protein [Nitrososphaeria archaeon]